MNLWRSIIKELRRLNSGRIDRGKLSRMSRRQQSTAVKAALKDHHSNPQRCC